ncbi:unnamed protein product, partial [marine sediment metagenome]
SYAGDYLGVYVFMEKIKRDDDRVDIESLSPTDNSEPEITGGYIWKIDPPDPGDVGFTTSRGHPTHVEPTATTVNCYVYPKEVNLTPQQESWILNHFEEFEDALYGPNFADPFLGYAAYFDVDSFIDHYWLNELTKNPDAFRLSAYMFKKRGEKIQAGPIWDFDRTMGCADDDRAENPEGWYTFTNYDWWGRLAEDLEFEQKRIDRWHRLREDVFSVAGMHAVVDSMAAELTEAQARNFEKWPDTAPQFGGYQGEIDHLKQWLADRVAWIDS